MSAALLFGFLGSMLVGAILMILGVRGKRINDHPTCRDCRFDLSGVYPGVVTCPECGAVNTGKILKCWNCQVDLEDKCLILRK